MVVDIFGEKCFEAGGGIFFERKEPGRGFPEEGYF
jgi:hypothetical protein